MAGTVLGSGNIEKRFPYKEIRTMWQKYDKTHRQN